MHYRGTNPKGDGGTEFTCVGFEREGRAWYSILQWSRRCSRLEPELSENNKTCTKRRRTVLPFFRTWQCRENYVWRFVGFDINSINSTYVTNLISTFLYKWWRQRYVRIAFSRRHINCIGLNKNTQFRKHAHNMNIQTHLLITQKVDGKKLRASVFNFLPTAALRHKCKDSHLICSQKWL